ncbi:MAG: hypothetical protein CMJ65_14820 [Planctomycetaceae bacterium]|jgi:hypothetical protein|nr:hypothetical protein [Planctomycetaceae bacterium]MDP7275660.1 DUF1501 domain-containing protein [Planctomycetaceae bacterium]
MLTIPGTSSRYCDGISRRSFLEIGGLGLGGAALPRLLEAADRSGNRQAPKNIIMVLLPGGPSHIDMWDLKPEAPANIRGEFSPIASSVPGIEISELFPRTARMMEKLIVLRTLVGIRDDHNVHWCVTGRTTHPQQTGSREIPGYAAGGWPSLGAVVSKVHGPRRVGVPPVVDLAPAYYDARFVNSVGLGQGGYLGAAHSAFETATVDRSNMALNGVSLDRLSDRRSLLTSFDRFRRSADVTGMMDGLDVYARQAFEMMTSPRLARALDLSQEDRRSWRRYGLDGIPESVRAGNKHLDQFLLARRVIEAGARCVTLCFSRFPFGRMLKGDYNWDWHKDNFTEARATLPMLDQGVAGLIEDLEQRGLLEETMVVVWGEFGRTPRINANAGRDHWPRVAAGLLAGGGLRAGQVVGTTNRNAEEPVDRPVDIREVFATLYHQFGIDVRTTLFTDLSGRPQYLVPDAGPMPELV